MSRSRSQRAHDVNTTSPQRRCNVMVLYRRWGDVVYTSCTTSPQRRSNVMTLHRRWGDVVFTSCTTSPQRRCNVMTLHRRWGDVVFMSCARWDAIIDHRLPMSRMSKQTITDGTKTTDQRKQINKPPLFQQGFPNSHKPHKEQPTKKSSTESGW